MPWTGDAVAECAATNGGAAAARTAERFADQDAAQWKLIGWYERNGWGSTAQDKIPREVVDRARRELGLPPLPPAPVPIRPRTPAPAPRAAAKETTMPTPPRRPPPAPPPVAQPKANAGRAPKPCCGSYGDRHKARCPESGKRPKNLRPEALSDATLEQLINDCRAVLARRAAARRGEA
jgi:hypothetical protein